MCQNDGNIYYPCSEVSDFKKAAGKPQNDLAAKKHANLYLKQ